MHDTILILDFGSQVTQLIARRIRECQVYCEVQPCDISDESLRQRMKEGSLKGIILSGSHASVYEADTPQAPKAVFELGVPVLGICYGMQTMAAQLGGKVEYSEHREFGGARLKSHGATKLLAGFDAPDEAAASTSQAEAGFQVWMSHGDKVTQLPPGFVVMASNASCPIAAIADENRGFYGLQFHPEVTHTPRGRELLQRFAVDICGCSADWTMPGYQETAIAKIREQVGSDHVILGLSGGVDSSVAAALIQRAIGDQLTCVFVDHGLLRWRESEQVMALFADHLGVNVVRRDASARFLEALAGVDDPEQKRKIIGREFVEVFQAEAQTLTNAKWLAQGTIYPDVIESAGAHTKKATTIKSHHNVGGLPASLNLKLLEPLRDLFKDEVRELGLSLGLPAALVNRHPFPGPGLAVRILGAVNTQAADLLKRADAIFIELLRDTLAPDGRPWYDHVAQAFAVFLPVKSVGVMGDGRTYENVVALRAVQTTDFMTADWAPLPYELLARASNRIINEVRGVNRVVYDISSKPPATIEWE